MRAPLTYLGFGTAAVAAALALCGCDTAMRGLVGPSKQQADAAAEAAAPLPPPPPTASFMTDSDLVPGFAGNAALAPTLEIGNVQGAGVDEPLPPSSAGPHKAIISVPLSSDAKALAALGMAANRDAEGGGDASFVLLVLSPAANSAEAMDRANAAARNAADHAVTAMGAAGILADRIQISMATNPNVGDEKFASIAAETYCVSRKRKMVEPRFRTVQP